MVPLPTVCSLSRALASAFYALRSYIETGFFLLKPTACCETRRCGRVTEESSRKPNIPTSPVHVILMFQQFLELIKLVVAVVKESVLVEDLHSSFSTLYQYPVFRKL